MAINKFQRSRLTFGLSYWSPINRLTCETTKPIELKIYMKTSYDRLAKIYANCSGHMTKMATTPIYSKN